ncbi:MAG TPA: hypothetical protein VKD72_35890 [Gemmataceae bacterium]|nr:hypothetical protein [Gemmataceae bacterium]
MAVRTPACDRSSGTVSWGWVSAYSRVGKSEQARGHLLAAATMFRDMNMSFWLAQADSELRVLA